MLTPKLKCPWDPIGRDNIPSRGILSKKQDQWDFLALTYLDGQPVTISAIPPLYHGGQAVLTRLPLKRDEIHAPVPVGLGHHLSAPRCLLIPLKSGVTPTLWPS